MKARRALSGVTLTDVARAAEVSASTASRVLNGGKPVSPELDARVRACADKLGYIANRSARAMRGRQQLLAILGDQIGVETLAEVAASAEDAATADGLVTTVSSAEGDPENQLLAFRVLKALGPRAFLLTGGWLTAPEIRERLQHELTEYMRADHGRVVVVGAGLPGLAHVSFDEYEAGLQIGRHVAARAQSVLVIAGPDREETLRTRTRGVVAGLSQAGSAHVDVVHCANHRLESAAATARALSRWRPQGVVAVNDRMAVGVYAALEQYGYRIPDDVIVAGIDDLPAAAELEPELTTFAQPFARAGVEAVRMALADDPPVESLVLRGHLVVRGSTRAGQPPPTT